MLILAFPLLALVSCAAKENDSLLARQKYREALKYSSVNLKDKMYANLKEAAELAPAEPSYLLTLGDSYFSDGRLEEAEKTFLQVLQLDANSVEAHRRLGRLYMQQKKWNQAIDNLKASLKTPGVSFPHQVHNWLAVSYYAQGDFGMAEKEWLHALRIDENAAIRLNLALAYRDHEQFDKALGSLEKALSASPKLVQAHHQIALLFLKKKDIEGARKHFQEVIDLNPQSDLAEDSRKYMELMEPAQ
ncbi:MAG: tetratricopeptide repeat protein [Nitrospinales bacterium]